MDADDLIDGAVGLIGGIIGETVEDSLSTNNDDDDNKEKVNSPKKQSSFLSKIDLTIFVIGLIVLVLISLIGAILWLFVF